MSQNRNKLLQLLMGNLVNVVVHQVLEKAVQEELLRNHYGQESMTSFEVAKRYREKINPARETLPDKDVSKIREEVSRRAIKELNLRISQGYKGIEPGLVEEILDRILKELKILTPTFVLKQKNL